MATLKELVTASQREYAEDPVALIAIEKLQQLIEQKGGKRHRYWCGLYVTDDQQIELVEAFRVDESITVNREPNPTEATVARLLLENQVIVLPPPTVK